VRVEKGALVRSHEIGSTEVDGVPVFYTDDAIDPDRLVAVLMFRVGVADERLTTAGITHMVEHLVMHGVGSTTIDDPHSNASVDLLTTQFQCAGRPDEVVEFLREVCRSIGTVELSRLTPEQRIIQAETGRRGYSVLAELAVWRYGVAGPGLLQWQDVAISQLSPELVATWAADHFTAGNAALFLSRPPPAGLELPLPPGPRRSVPVWPQVSPAPAWFPINAAGTAVSSLVNRSTAAIAYASVFTKRLRTRLREDLGLSYEQWVQYVPLGAEKAMVAAFADHSPNSQEQVASAFATTFMTMAQRSASADELEDWRRHYDEGAGRGASLALAAARDTLLGSAIIDDSELRNRVDAVTPNDILDVASQASSQALYAVPLGVSSVGDGVKPAPVSSTSPVLGPTNPSHVWRAHDYHADRGRLYLSDDGVGLFRHDRHALSARWTTCAAMLRWADGGRALITRDGAVLTVEPTMWAHGAKLVDLLDERIPADRQISLPARAAGSIPRPTRRYRWWKRLTAPNQNAEPRDTDAGGCLAGGLVVFAAVAATRVAESEVGGIIVLAIAVGTAAVALAAYARKSVRH
jgi:zinc protease